MTDAERRALVTLLSRLPQTASFDGRSALLAGIPGELRRSESSPRVDLALMVTGLEALGGEGFVRALIENARSFAAGTPLDAALAGAVNPLNTQEFLRLRDALAGLFLTLSEARVLCTDCGLDLRAVDLSGSAEAFWGAILRGAVEQHALGVLVARAQEVFPRSAALAEAAKSAGAIQRL